MVLKVDKRSAWLFAELYFIVQYDFLESIQVLSTIGKIARAAFLMYELVVLLQNRHRYTGKSTGVLLEAGIGIFALYQMFVSLMFHSVSYVYTFNYFVRMLLLLVCLENSFRYSFTKTTATLKNFFLFTFALNLLTVLMFRNGITQTISETGNLHENYLLGVDNQFGKIFFPGFAIIWFVSLLNKKKTDLSTYAALLSIIFIYVYKSNGTGVVVSLLLFLLFVCYHLPGLNRFVSLKIFLIVIAALYAGIFTGLGPLFGNSALRNNIIQITGKSATFSGRTNIWTLGVIKFFESPIIGYGLSIRNASIIYRNRLYTAHNLVLQTALDGGIVGLIFLLAPVVNALRKADAAAEAGSIVRTLYIGFFLTLLYSLMEVGSIVPLLIMFLLLSHYTDYQHQTSVKEKSRSYISLGQPPLLRKRIQ